ncbi:MAG: hypothetical protein CSB06_00985 [Bacteroidia bacterium]|nr:MAG: hypothetical protein CSB06_00985 [Bacteroidia bacterium]
MRIKTSCFLLLLGAVLLQTSCIKDEAPNCEADILKIYVPGNILQREPIISNEEIVCYVNEEAYLKEMAPTFDLTEGAKITPKSGSVRDFTRTQNYMVTSEDGKWKKTYVVKFKTAGSSLTKFHFDYRKKERKYYVIYERDANNEESIVWASGNSGFASVAGSRPPEEYPTTTEPKGYKNQAVKLVTLSTGALGAIGNSPIAAGSLFLGVFDLNISAPLKSTHFGIPFNSVPVKLKGYYKYKSGEVFKQHTDNDGQYISDEGKTLNRKDSCDIYAVLYEVDPGNEYLDGTNVLTHPSIVSVARLDKIDEAEDWTFFEIPFALKNGKTIDPERLRLGGYNLTVVFSSSKEGNRYNGAVGSTLLIDEVELEVE